MPSIFIDAAFDVAAPKRFTRERGALTLLRRARGAFDYASIFIGLIPFHAAHYYAFRDFR